MGLPCSLEYVAVTMLNVKGLSLVFRSDGDFVLQVPSLKLSAGETIAIVGESGSGKSTILDMIGLVLRPAHVDNFELNIPGEGTNDIKALWKTNNLDRLSDIRRKHIGYVLQTGELFPFLNVRQNILLTARLKGMEEKEVQESFDETIDTLFLRDYLARYPGELSIGQRQRVAIARAVCHRPGLILADEPTAALDPKLAAQVMELFLKATQKTNSALILVSHDISLVDRFGLQRRVIEVTTDDAKKRSLAELKEGS